jgi:hypothetical protein
MEHVLSVVALEVVTFASWRLLKYLERRVACPTLTGRCERELACQETKLALSWFTRH